MVEWRRFLVESLVLVVLMVLFGVIVVAMVLGFVNPLVAPSVLTLAFAIVAIARYEH